ncbi:hypothetical protein J3F84DRAFT_364716 [Trichoderma pleuroticola]
MLIVLIRCTPISQATPSLRAIVSASSNIPIVIDTRTEGFSSSSIRGLSTPKYMAQLELER